jgi:hypothetical protein
MPPAVLDLDLGGWVPTVQLTVHLRGRPAPGWLRVRSTTKAMIDGYLDEEAEFWDSDGNLVAQSRRLAMLSAPGISARTDWFWAGAVASDT